MSKLQVSRVELAKAANKLQVSRVELTVPSVTATRTLQISRIELDAQVSTAPVITAVSPATQTVDPMTTVTMQVSISGSYTAINWTQQAGSPTVQVGGANTPTISFEAPATLAGITVRFTVNATGPGGSSNTVTLSAAVGPQIEWLQDASANWVGALPVVVL